MEWSLGLPTCLRRVPAPERPNVPPLVPSPLSDPAVSPHPGSDPQNPAGGPPRDFSLSQGVPQGGSQGQAD